MRLVGCLVALAALVALPAAAAGPRVPAFKRVVVVVFENKEIDSVMGTPEARTFNLYARRYVNMTSYYGLTHPSLPNYLALVSGSTQGVTTNCDCPVNGRSLADTLEAARHTWKTYAEGLPAPGFTGTAAGLYGKRHNPFIYFENIAGNPARRARVVPLTQLEVDFRAKTLPDFSLVIPDFCNSMHDCSVAVGDAWLRRTVGPLLHLKKTAIFILFDEGRTNLGGGGHVPGLVVGTAARTTTYRAEISHYSVLRTIEDAWRLPRLGQSATARPITGIWR